MINKFGKTSVVLKRLRDYHHPDGTLTDKSDKVSKWQKYNKFVVSLLAFWLKSDKKDSKIILDHLQEMASNPDVGRIIIQFL